MQSWSQCLHSKTDRSKKQGNSLNKGGSGDDIEEEIDCRKLSEMSLDERGLWRKEKSLLDWKLGLFQNEAPTQERVSVQGSV